MKDPCPPGILWIGVLFVLSSGIQIIQIPGYERYAFINQELPEGMIQLRFVLSYVVRIAGLMAGIGILWRRDVWRRAAIGLSLFLLLTTYWRHGYQAFLIYTEPLYRQAGNIGYSLEMFTWVNVVIRWVLEGCFFLVVMYYLTRPGVVRHFR